MVEQGFKPVGNDFPVFLHPLTHEEYALARTERKLGRGYKGFIVQTSPDVTLEEDLRRRDLTINAMARSLDGRLIDPYGGIQDCQNRTLRHVSEAFIEDPVRILRVARFAARFKSSLGFTVAPETLTLMTQMSASGELDSLVPERVWQEMARGLMEETPSEFFRVLDNSDALFKIFPAIIEGWPHYQQRSLDFLDQLASLKSPLCQRYAGWLLALFAADHSKKPMIERIAQQLKCPKECQDLSLLAYTLSQEKLDLITHSAEHTLSLVEKADGLRRAQRYQEALRLVLLLQQHTAAEVASHPLYQAASLLKQVKLPTDNTLSVPQKIALLRALRIAALHQAFFY
jgi:tRNA nucleotidyltransferase (CCA-adding enzyme)